MTEKELIKKIKQLRKVKPRKDWVLATKFKILGEESKFELFPFFKPAYAGLFLILIFFGLIEFSQSALPGDLLYPLKRITEKAQAVFISQEEKPKVSLELANKRLEELTSVAQANQVKNLAPAINEFQASVFEAAKNLSKLSDKDPKVIKNFVDKAKEIKNKAEEVSKSFGVVIGNEELNELQDATTKLELEAVVIMLKDTISRLESSLKMGALTVEEEKMLIKMKELVEEGKYSEALEFYLVNKK